MENKSYHHCANRKVPSPVNSQLRVVWSCNAKVWKFVVANWSADSLLGGEITINPPTLHFCKLLHSRFQQKSPTKLNWSISILRSNQERKQGESSPTYHHNFGHQRSANIPYDKNISAARDPARKLADSLIRTYHSVK